jgi:outer membrane protein OmpA-like peptidoglycan-associated protein
MAMKMEFNPSKSEIEPKYRDGLTQVANFMKANPGIIATVEGHADRVVGIGSEKVKVDHNVAMEVSERRAQNVVNYLADNLGCCAFATFYGSVRPAWTCYLWHYTGRATGEPQGQHHF